jgi:sortase A
MKTQLLVISLLITFCIFGKNYLNENYSGEVLSQSSADITGNQELIQSEKSTDNDLFHKTVEKIEIPKINVSSVVESVGMDENGRMAVPVNDMDVAWWSLGTFPGESGNAVIAGHLDKKDGSPSVFYYLQDLNIGDLIYVYVNNWEKLTFKVTQKQNFNDKEFPINLIFGQTQSRNLNLITCSGTYDKVAKNYGQRLVVFTRLQ